MPNIDDILKVCPIFFKTSSDPPFLKLTTRFPDDKASKIVRGKLSIIEVQIYISDNSKAQQFYHLQEFKMFVIFNIK